MEKVRDSLKFSRKSIKERVNMSKNFEKKNLKVRMFCLMECTASDLVKGRVKGR